MTTIDELYYIFNLLRVHGAKTDKERILKENENNKLFRYTLKFLYDPFILTGISTKKINKEIEPLVIEDEHHFETIKDVMEYLRNNYTGTNYNVYVVQEFINKQEDNSIKAFIKEIVTKDLKVGITEKTINKVYGKGEIPSFGVMLAESYSKKMDKVTGEFYITLKLDGNRCIAINEKNGVKFYSRKGQPIEHMHELEEQFKHLPTGMVYDGEVLLVNKDNLSSDKLFRATQKVIRKDGVKEGLEFHIFDALPIKEFKDGKSSLKYEVRRRNVLDMTYMHIESTTGETKEFTHPNIHVLPVLYQGTDKSVIPTIMKEVEDAGQEGLMINTADGLYITKRTNALLKVKTMQTADLIVLSVEKAINGAFKGLLGRVNVEYKGNSVGVGSGFTLKQRTEFIENPELIIGKIIEVSYFEESKDEKTGKPSLRFPIFKGIREDKDIGDVNYE